MSSQAAGPGLGAPAPLTFGQVMASPLSFSISTSGPLFVSLKLPETPEWICCEVPERGQI